MSGGNSGLTIAIRMDQLINVILHALAWGARTQAPGSASGIVACGRHVSAAHARSDDICERAASDLRRAIARSSHSQIVDVGDGIAIRWNRVCASRVLSTA